MIGLRTPSVGYKPYLGGLFDGEGSVSIGKKKGKNGYNYYPVLTLTNTDQRPLRMLQEWLGGSIHESKRGVNYVIYSWHVSHKKAYEAADALSEYTLIKQRELVLVANFYEDMKDNGIKQRSASRWGQDITTFVQERENCYGEYLAFLGKSRQENRTPHPVSRVQTL